MGGVCSLCLFLSSPLSSLPIQQTCQPDHLDYLDHPNKHAATTLFFLFVVGPTDRIGGTDGLCCSSPIFSQCRPRLLLSLLCLFSFAWLAGWLLSFLSLLSLLRWWGRRACLCRRVSRSFLPFPFHSAPASLRIFNFSFASQKADRRHFSLKHLSARNPNRGDMESMRATWAVPNLYLHDMAHPCLVCLLGICVSVCFHLEHAWPQTKQTSITYFQTHTHIYTCSILMHTETIHTLF